jgi:hypothetical protein
MNVKSYKKTKKGVCLPDASPAAGAAASQKQGSQTSADQG